MLIIKNHIVFTHLLMSVMCSDKFLIIITKQSCCFQLKLLFSKYIPKINLDFDILNTNSGNRLKSILQVNDFLSVLVLNYYNHSYFLTQFEIRKSQGQLLKKLRF